MRIDTHAHLLPGSYLRKVSELGGFDELSVFQIMKAVFRVNDADPGAQRGFGDDHDARIADMDAGGVDYQVLSLGAAQPYFADAEKAAEAAAVANDSLGEVTARFPGRLGAFGAVPLPHVDRAIAEAARCLDELGFLGINIGCSASGVTLDDPTLDPFWAELNARKAIVHIHPGVAMDGVVGCTEHHLAPDFVGPAEIAVAVSRLILSGMPSRYPDVSIILASTGGALPFFGARYDDGLLKADPDHYAELGGFTRHLQNFHYDTSVLEEPLVLKTAAERFGVAQVMLGSDYPRPSVTSKRAVDYVQSADFLTVEDKSSILDHNAYALLKHRLPEQARSR